MHGKGPVSPAIKIANGRRVETLDGVQGICAAIVVAYHSLLVWPVAYSAVANDGQGLSWLFHSPLVLAVSGTSSVSVFFVLSGFVLALSFAEKDSERVGPFWIKRFVRVWLPYAFAIGCSALAMALLVHRPAPGVRAWVTSSSWSEPLSLRRVLAYGLML